MYSESVSVTRYSSQMTLTSSSESHANIGYVWSSELESLSDQLPCHPNRSCMVHSLIQSYGLLNHISVIQPMVASRETLEQFHATDYLDTLLQSEATKYDDAVLEEYGLLDDASVFPGLSKYCQLVAGSTVAAAQALASGDYSIVINWEGGRHHAHRDRAAGFCYVNDIVLGIMALQNTFKRIMYIDLDVHHGDGVQEAFEFSPRVMNLSFHRHDPGMYPGSGSLDESGKGRGRYHAINVPLAEGTSGSTFVNVVTRTVSKAMQVYKPDAVVIQSGADALSGDPLGGLSNVDIISFGQCLSHVLNFKKPTLILGGGGYINSSVARCWSYCTAIALHHQKNLNSHESSLDNVGLATYFPSEYVTGDNVSIPEHAFFSNYGPDFQLLLDIKNRKDLNDPDKIDTMLNEIFSNLEVLRGKYEAVQ